MSESQTVSITDFSERSWSEADLLDVRTAIEFREAHIGGATNISLDQLDPQSVMARRNGSSVGPLFVICQSGKRGEKAQQRFAEAGYSNVMNIEGGTDAWIAAGHPVVRGKKAVSLERQVRITAGFIVLVGALLGIFVHPYLAGIAAFVGAGLMFAGVTDTCAMGMLMARMPWNRVSANCCVK